MSPYGKRTDLDIWWTILSSLFKCIRLGWKKFDINNALFFLARLILFILEFIVFLSFPWPYFLPAPHPLIQFLILDTLVFLFFLAVIGAFEFAQGLKFQKALRLSGIVSSKNLPPKVKSFKFYVDHSLSMSLDILGLDPKIFDKKRGIIESTFGLYFHDFTRGENPRYGQLRLTPKTLPLNYPFEKALSLLKNPYSVVIGRGMGGPIIESIEDWPHGLIAGSTGSGKSVQMKSIVAQFLHSLGLKTKESPHPSAQVILCDLKGGVELGVFEAFENVSIYSNIKQIDRIFKKIVSEMMDRFKLMREESVQKIVSEKHNRDFILIAVDEASLLYRRTHKGHPDFESIESVRASTQKILKLGRAAKISVIFGLQRPSKESIDTEIQENIDARMCFKINTLEGSIRMLGHKKGIDLPTIAGRGIWKFGNEEIVFQAPLVSNADIQKIKVPESLKQSLIKLDSSGVQEKINDQNLVES
ncbi:MAG: FtsK/SpoIIIE domain-containing protein [Bacteriovoracales bacterium]|nr:FtsK/SpoIIIE domain-containing protein [Bacteriovoracales bacterium]